MRTLVLAAVLLTVGLSAQLSLAAEPGGGAEYRLGVGDELRVKVFEWRSATGDVHEWAALNGNYEIGADGMIAMPLLGAVGAAGMTTGQLADGLSNQLQSRLGLTIKPQASIEIVRYRPFYILGDVSKPGEYPYRPGLTVLEAISIAGGRYRVNDPALLLNASGNLRVLSLQYTQLLARRARLQAELDDADTIALPPELQRQQSDPNIAQLIHREQSLLAARREAMSAQVTALSQLKSLLNGEVASLQQKMHNVDQELRLRKQELNSTTSLVRQGLAIAPREYSLRETQLQTEGRRLDLDTAALRAKEELAKADQAIVDLRNKTRTEVHADLADVEQKILETAARMTTSMTIVDRETSRATGNPAAAANEEAAARSVILRRGDGKTKQLDADEATRIEPGDTIKVLRATEEAALSGANPVDAAAAPPTPATTRPAPANTGNRK